MNANTLSAERLERARQFSRELVTMWSYFRPICKQCEGIVQEARGLGREEEQWLCVSLWS